LKLSIVTISFNSANTIEKTIRSVVGQSYQNFEYIVVDGGSTDGTVQIIEKYREKITYFVSEKDYGLYHAMNKGIEKTTGDIIGMINSDDYYLDSAFEKVIQAFKGKKLEEYILWGDISYKDSVVKGWREENLRIGAFAPHPSMFCPKAVYEKIGVYKLWYKILADYDFMYRAIHKHQIKPIYLSETLAFFRDGGVASQNIFRALTEEMLVKVEYGEKMHKAFGVYMLKLLKNINRIL